MENKESGIGFRRIAHDASGIGDKSNAAPIQALRGMKDMLPQDAAKWREVRQVVDDVAAVFGYGEISTPIIESARLFKRSVGEETDIISKEMYIFTDKGGEEIALRPELTAPVIRAAIEHGMLTGQSDCVRLYYNCAANFRYEKPQLGRLRQHHQFGTELLGPASPMADAETISFAITVFQRLGLKNFHVRLNSLLSAKPRSDWKQNLSHYLRQHAPKLSNDSQRRSETNPMRVLDSKAVEDQDIIKNAPSILDYLAGEDKSHFDELQVQLRSVGIHYSVDPFLVRGIDYYTRTVFEITSTDLGAQDALCGGGRYDNLVEELGGPPTPAIGFGAGIERLLIALEKARGSRENVGTANMYVVAQSGMARTKVLELTNLLRQNKFRAICDLNDRSMKAQMRESNREGAKYVFIIGESELAEGVGILKNMQTGEQEKVAFEGIVARLAHQNS